MKKREEEEEEEIRAFFSLKMRGQASMRVWGNSSHLSGGLKETEMKEDGVITGLDTQSDKAGAHLPQAGALLKSPAGRSG